MTGPHETRAFPDQRTSLFSALALFSWGFHHFAALGKTSRKAFCRCQRHPVLEQRSKSLFMQRKMP